MHASFTDLEAILDLCQEAHDLSDTYADMPANRDKARGYISAMLLNPHCFVGFNGNGVLMAVASPSWWGDGLIIGDLFFYARKGGLELMRAYLDWAKAWPGQNQINLGVTFGGDAGERTEKLYERLGLVRSGANFRVK